MVLYGSEEDIVLKTRIFEAIQKYVTSVVLGENNQPILYIHFCNNNV